MLGTVSVELLLDRPTYLYSEVDRLVRLPGGTAKRWINGYERAGKPYEPILRLEPKHTEWATWGEFVETRILAEYRDQNIPTVRLRGAVQNLRQLFDTDYPLAYLQPYLAAAAGELAIDRQGIDASDEPGLMILRTRQLLLDAPSRNVIDHATLALDDRGRKFASELTPDTRFEGIVINPDRQSGQPTFAGRRIPVATIAGMAAAGDPRDDLAADYGLSLAQVQAAIDYCAAYDLTA